MEYMENNNNKFLIVEAALKSFFFFFFKKTIYENVRISTRYAQSVWPKGEKNPDL